MDIFYIFFLFQCFVVLYDNQVDSDNVRDGIESVSQVVQRVAALVE